MSVKAKKAGMIILGGGVCKHQIANAMLFVSILPSRLDDADSVGIVEERCGLRRIRQHRPRG